MPLQTAVGEMFVARQGGDAPRRLVVAGLLAFVVPLAVVAFFSLFL